MPLTIQLLSQQTMLYIPFKTVKQKGNVRIMSQVKNQVQGKNLFNKSLILDKKNPVVDLVTKRNKNVVNLKNIDDPKAKVKACNFAMIVNTLKLR